MNLHIHFKDHICIQIYAQKCINSIYKYAQLYLNKYRNIPKFTCLYHHI